jgi:hypothetical protein
MPPINFIKKLSMCVPSPLSRLLGLAPFRTKFLEDYGTFVKKIYQPGAGLVERITEYYNFHEPYLASDFWFRLDTFATHEDVKNDLYGNLVPFVEERMSFLVDYFAKTAYLKKK